MDSLRGRFVVPAFLACAALVASCGGGSSGNNTGEQPSACEVVSDAGTVVLGSGLPGDPTAPEPASGYRVGKKVVTAHSYMVVTANPLASKAGCDVMKAGGSAVDAAVAVQMVLGLVEPQSSGLGGGAFMLHYDAESGAVQAYDGRETAPAAATENYLRYVDDTFDQTEPLPSTRASGRSIGTPGVIRMLELAHQEHGRMAWKDLFAAGVQLATDGFRIGGRMTAAIANLRADFLRDADASATYLNADGSPKELGTVLKIPAYAATLTALANGGADAFYTGPIAQAMVDKINVTASADDSTAITPGKTTLADLAGYHAIERDGVCTSYRGYWVCGVPPPAGGITVAAVLGILENFDLGALPPTDVDLEGGKPQVQAVHLISEAERLAYADRNTYVADTDFVPLPGGSPDRLLDKTYLADRAALIDPNRSMGTALAGVLEPDPPGSDPTPEHGTTHVTIVDRDGNVVTMTTTVESSFGSFHMTRGFILNNELSDFSAAPVDDHGEPIANRLEANKRPRSSMAPTLVFTTAADGSRGDFVMATGSPGGSTIIQYVVKTLVGALDWHLDAQQATSLVDFGAANTPTTNVGGEHPDIIAANDGADDPLVIGLRALGHTVSLNAQSSGISTIIRGTFKRRPVLTGGADPRREGIVLGDTFTPH